MAIEIRDADSRDLPTVLAINQAAVPHVGSITLERMQRFHDRAAYFRVALAEGSLAAFLIGLTPEADYDSPNFLWFRRNYAEFAYIDRVAVAGGARRSGLGSALYRDFEQFFSGRMPRIACEVNLRPSNEPSMDSHRRHGFVQVGSQEIEGGAKEVAMLVKELTS